MLCRYLLVGVPPMPVTLLILARGDCHRSVNTRRGARACAAMGPLRNCGSSKLFRSVRLVNGVLAGTGAGELAAGGRHVARPVRRRACGRLVSDAPRTAAPPSPRVSTPAAAALRPNSTTYMCGATCPLPTRTPDAIK